MKKFLIFGVFALLTTTLFSCSADDLDNAANSTNKETIKPETVPASYATGPEDDPIVVPPPPKK